jgi:hypothetical protein
MKLNDTGTGIEREEETKRAILRNGVESNHDENEDTETGDRKITVIFQQRQLWKDLRKQ